MDLSARRCAAACLYADLRQKIRALPVAHADETSWRHDGNPYWAWYAGNRDLAFFHLDAHRSGQGAQTVLGERFHGTLVADAYASYNGVHPKDRQSCLAQIKTKAKELEQELTLLKGKAADPDALQFCQSIQGWVRDACQAHTGFATALGAPSRPSAKAERCANSCALFALLRCGRPGLRPFANDYRDRSKSSCSPASDALTFLLPTTKPSVACALWSS
jgi:hypothetical protein